MSLERNIWELEVSKSNFWNNVECLKRTLLFLRSLPKKDISIVDCKEEIKIDEDLSESSKNNADVNDKRLDLLKRIEIILQDVVKKNSLDAMPTLSVPNRKLWKNASFDEDHGLQMNENPSLITMKKRRDDPRARKFGLTVHLLSKVHHLLRNNEFCTKRELYYQDVKLYSSQAIVDNILDDIACMLSVQRIQLHVLTTSKGCIAGHLYFKDADSHYIDCTSTNQGCLLPNDINGISNIYSDARFILIVEKDAIFQVLLESDFMKRLHPCIVITGKGFPDVNTRQMVKRLWDTLEIPILALVDADPYGIEILCLYTYGSLALSFDVKNLAVPHIRWLGILPSDIQNLKLPDAALQPLTAQDVKRAKSLLLRPYMLCREGWRQQIQLMQALGKKAEIEGLCKINDHFLTDIYLPNKIKYGGWI